MTTQRGAEVARGSGTGTDVDWTWDSSGRVPRLVRVGDPRWLGPSGDRDAARGRRNCASLAIEAAVAEPRGDQPERRRPGRHGDRSTYRLNAPANVTVEVTDVIGGVLATVVDRVWTHAGQHAVTIDGSALADGDYSVVVTARTAAGVSVQRVIPLSVEPDARARRGRACCVLAERRRSQGHARDRYALTAPAFVRIRIEREGRWVASPLVGNVVPAAPDFLWDGTRATGRCATARTTLSSRSTSATGLISYARPVRLRHGRAPRSHPPRQGARVQVSEPSLLTFVIDGRALRREVMKAGTVRIPWSGPAARVRVVAWDAAGNVSGPVVRSRGDD